ncbi:MAG: hypothetical protein HOH75_05680 [Chloroflexi bacterium]|jgi:hypothetical protein|nr:hypothetical protein [Chloroflexota bacterium]
MIDFMQIAQDGLAALLKLAAMIMALSAIDAVAAKKMKSQLYVAWKMAQTTFAFAGGIAVVLGASSYVPALDPSLSGAINIVHKSSLALPSNAIPAEIMLSMVLPPGAIPSNYIPSNAIPAEALPASAIPAEALPASAMPAEALPSNAIPAEIAASGKLQRLPDLGEEVCGLGRCGENTKYSYYSDEPNPQASDISVEVEIWADAYNLDVGECTNVHWLSIAAEQVWLDSDTVEANGVREVCPKESTSYGINASGPDGSKVGSSISINISAPEEQSQAGVELAGPNRCDLFDGKSMKITYLDWMPGAPLQFHIKMPGGIPGLEKDIIGDNNPWEYTVQIGNTSSSECEIIEGYKERLYCSIPLPKEDANSMRSMSLSVNGCDDLIYDNKTAFLPGYAEVKNSGGGGDAGEETNSCPAGQAYYGPTVWWGGGCCSDGHWYILSGDTEPGCWN